jgi:hypothetical protein
MPKDQGRWRLPSNDLLFTTLPSHFDFSHPPCITTSTKTRELHFIYSARLNLENRSALEGRPLYMNRSACFVSTDSSLSNWA